MSVEKVGVRSVIIIGAGIGGLALGHLLKASDVSVSIYERDSDAEARQQGYAIGINEIGLPVLNRIIPVVPGLDKLLDSKNSLSGFVITNEKLDVLLSFEGDKNSSVGTLVSRWGLRACLAKDLNIYWNKRFVSYEEKDDGVIAYFEDGTTATADVLVGADGAKSVVRKQRSPKLINHDQGFTTMGGVLGSTAIATSATIQTLIHRKLVRVFGSSGHSLLFLSYINEKGNDDVVWAMSWPTSEDDRQLLDESNKNNRSTAETLQLIRSRLIEKAKKCFSHKDITELISLSPVATFIPARQIYCATPGVTQTEILGTTPSRVVLLGDAAHPMTTHRGLGANTALADASDLAEALLRPEPYTTTLPDYDTKMFSRGFTAVKQSLLSTQSIHTVGFKSFLLRLVLRLIGFLLQGYRLIKNFVGS